MGSEIAGLRSRSIPVRAVRGDLDERANSTEERSARILRNDVGRTPVGGELTGTVDNAAVVVGGDLDGPISSATVIGLLGRSLAGPGEITIPWESGDTETTLWVGSNDSDNDRIAIEAVSYSATALKGLTYDNANTMPAVAGYNNGAGTGVLGSSVDSHGVEAYSVNGRSLYAWRNTETASEAVGYIHQAHASNEQHALYVRQAADYFGIYSVAEHASSVYPAVYGLNEGDGPGVAGVGSVAGNSNGVDAVAHGGGDALSAFSDGTGRAIYARRNVDTNDEPVVEIEQLHASSDGVALVISQSGTAAAVQAIAQAGDGLDGSSASGAGVYGLSTTGTAIKGLVTSGTAPGALITVDGRNGDDGDATGVVVHVHRQSDATTTAVTVLQADHTTVNYGTVAAGFGVDSVTRLTNDTNEVVPACRQRVEWADPSDGSEDGGWSVAVSLAGSLTTGIEVKGLVGGMAIGFMGAGPITRPALAAAAGPTYGAPEQTLLNDLRSALINLGLCT